MRRGEIANIQVDHLTKVKDIPLLSIPETKTDIPRVIPLSERAQEAIGTILRSKEEISFIQD